MLMFTSSPPTTTPLIVNDVCPGCLKTKLYVPGDMSFKVKLAGVDTLPMVMDTVLVDTRTVSCLSSIVTARAGLTTVKEPLIVASADSEDI